MIKEIKAKALLSSSKDPDPWFGLKYTMNLYRGCQHQCIYCDSRSECYQIEDFGDILVKTNAIDLLRKELSSKRVKGTVGTGSMHDPYMPIEKTYNLTGRALEVISEFRFPVHVITKSDLVLRDVDKLKDIGRTYAAVSFTVTAADDELARKLEPGAPQPSARFEAMAALSAAGILTGVTMMPILPFIEDNEQNVTEIATRAKDCGAAYIIPWFGMTLRDRQRAYYYDSLDRLFPGVRSRYEQRYGDQYSAPAPEADRLNDVFRSHCERLGLPTAMPAYNPDRETQMTMF